MATCACWWSDLFTSDFARAVWSNVVGGLVASAIVAGAVYVLIDRRLRRAEREQERAALVGDVLREVKREIDHNREQAEILLEHVPRDELPFPLFDVNGWAMLMQADVLTALDPDTLELLVKTYNRLRTSNDQYALAYDLLAGPTAAIARGLGELNVDIARHRRVIFDGLSERVRELIPVLDEARALVDRQMAG